MTREGVSPYALIAYTGVGFCVAVRLRLGNARSLRCRTATVQILRFSIFEKRQRGDFGGKNIYHI